MLVCRGTVIDSEGGRSLIHLSRERCENCAGSCAKFGTDDDIWFDEPLSIGKEVRIESSNSALSLGLMITLGLPMILGFLGLWTTQSSSIAVVLAVLGLALAIGICRLPLYKRTLKPKITYA